MQRIPIMMAEAGMVLARDICRSDAANGPPICGRGLALTDSLIERLKRMGVQTVFVEGYPVRRAGEKTPEELLSDLDRRFRKIADDTITGKLKKIYRSYLIKSTGA